MRLRCRWGRVRRTVIARGPPRGTSRGASSFPQLRLLGLAFFASVADWAGVDAPVTKGLLAIAGAIVGEDLRQGVPLRAVLTPGGKHLALLSGSRRLHVLDAATGKPVPIAELLAIASAATGR